MDSAFEICNHFDIGINDTELLARFEDGTLSAAEFPHERHVRVTQLLLERYARDEAYSRVEGGIRRIADAAGRPDAFHVTITRAWFELIALAPTGAPELVDRGLLTRYYSDDVLRSGREAWVEPDRAPLAWPPPAAARVDLAAVLRSVPAPVAVLAAKDGGDVRGVTVSSATSASLDPPLVLACLAKSSPSLDLVRRANVFSLSFLSSSQQHVAARFADRDRPDGAAQFAGIPHHVAAGAPVIADSAAWVSCALRATYDAGDHEIIVGEVVDGGRGAADPLVRS